MVAIDLTPFGFTPTESKVYQVLLTEGPGTGYAVARAAGLARANAYSALEGLVTKGAARFDEGQPKRFRPEPPATVLARLAVQQGQALDGLSRSLEGFGAPTSPSVLELTSPRAALQLLANELGRAQHSVRLMAPAEAYGPLSPGLRRVAAAGLALELYAQVPVTLPFARVEAVPSGHHWPGVPLIAIIDAASAIIAAREGSEVRGHWSAGPAFVASANHALDRLRTAP
jgi:HTH-type transcriptional regulator, sugar sensing transcriptional regulator